MQRRKQISGDFALRLICLMLGLCTAAEAQTDTDSDGLIDSVETNTGTYVSPTNTGTNPNLSDTDGDGVGDWYEVKASFTNPLQASSKPRVPYPLPDPNTSTGATNKRVKVYIMSGQSNMVGMGTMNGTIDKSLATYTGSGKKFPDLVNASGGWTTRKDVRYRGVISDITNAELSPANLGDKFGPELGFGYVMGWFHDEPVLLLKSSIGNRSLGWDILPKGSPGYGNPIPVTQGDWYGGKEYDRFFMDEEEWAHPDAAATNVVDVLDNFGTQYPAWAAQGFEIAGFVWWQGDKDRYNTNHANSYEANLVRLITQLRTYYSNRYPGKVVPNAPFVLATLGQTTPSTTDPEDKAIFNAQRAVDGSTGKYPQFAGNVKTVYSNPLSEGGASNDHYQERAGTYMLVGDALGRAMVDLLSPSSYTWALNQAGPSSWSNAANWTPNTSFPNGIDNLAALTNNITTNSQISLAAPITLGQLSIGDSTGNNAFSINSGHSITFSADTGSASLTRTATGTSADTISPAIILADPLTVSVNNNTGSLALNGTISETGGAQTLTKTGNGTLILNGSNTYTGDTIIDIGTLRLNTAPPTLAGGLTFGATAGGSNAGTLDLSNASATFAGACLVRTNSTYAITIGSGRTHQINGAFTVGYNTAALPHSTTGLDVTGSGTLSIGTSSTPTNANIQIGNGATTNVGNSGVLDMSGLANFYANLGTGSFRVGSPTNIGSANGGGSTVSLAANSTIQGSTLLLGSPDGSANSAATAIQSLKLGSGANIINVNTLNLAGIGSFDGRSNGRITFNGATGTLKIRSQTDPVNGRPSLNVGVVSQNTGVPQLDNLFDTSGHSADLRFGTMNLGFRTNGNGSTTGQFKFDAGTLDANNLTAGSRGGTAGATATATGTLSIGGGAVTINNTSNPIQLGVNSLGSGTASGTLNISGGIVTVAASGGNSIRLGNATTALGTANGTLNLTGGNLTVAGDIIRGAATGTSNAVVNLSGGTLNMNGHDLGAAGSGALTFTVESGTLQNVARINGTGGLTKTTSGTLLLQGNNTYIGDTTVNEGTLTLADNAQLTFVIGSTSGTNNRITGTGTLILNGDFIIDTTLTDASALTSGSWGIVNAASLTENFGASFSITGAGWSESANVWTRTVGSKKYTFSEATGTLTLSSAASFTSWINGFFPGVSDPAIIGADRDPDKDGIANGVEMVIGGNPQLGMDAAMLPTIEVVTNPVTTPAIPAGNYLLFTYRRSDLATTAGITAICETNSDLSQPWTPSAGAPGVVIQVDDNYNFTPPAASPTDRVRVYVPRAAHSTQFGRLKVMVP
jgi:autotransporter-associated beta strand protein